MNHIILLILCLIYIIVNAENRVLTLSAQTGFVLVSVKLVYCKGGLGEGGYH